MELSRYCIPWTPFHKHLEEAVVMLGSTAAVYHQDDKPFAVDGDLSFRRIPGTATGRELRYADVHYDHGCVDRDINCVFPLDRLHELAHEHRIGAVAEWHFSAGFTMALRDFARTTVPEIVEEVAKVRPDAVLLTGG
ncbi:MAG: hypothetical protein HY698_21695 [Deltaproteobacteria bacterium]|nr:hypothetical protein [Deltaproteobacteria bacterium]